MDLGVSAVALPDSATDFGKKFLAMIDTVQDLWKEYMSAACKRQTTPHMSMGSVVLDKKSPEEYNAEIQSRSGLIARARKELDASAPFPKARIQTLKINPDGCVTFQLEHDPRQDVIMSASELDVALGRVPTCQGEAAAGERSKFKQNEDGSHTVSRFQQLRLALGGQGCEIKGMYPSGHMVVVNLVDPEVMKQVPEHKLKELWTKCYRAWVPLKGQWFDLNKLVCLCYVERSLNEGSVVVAPLPGSQPKAFPETSEAAQSLLGGIFTATDNGDVLVHLEHFDARRQDRASGQWKTFTGEISEMAANQKGGTAGKHTEERLKAAFKVFDADNSNLINAAELKQVMTNLGEKLSDEEVNSMLLRADKDRSGQISFEEFSKLMMG